MSLRRAEAIVPPRDSCDLDGRLSGSLASFKFAIGVRFKKDRSDSFRKDLAPRPILLFQKNEGMAKDERMRWRIVVGVESATVHRRKIRHVEG